MMQDGRAVADLEGDGCGALNNSCSFYVRSQDGNALMTVVALEMLDYETESAGNPQGKVRFLRFSFSGTDGIAEVKNPAMLTVKEKHIAEIIGKAHLLRDGELDNTAVDNFIRANGARYTARQRQLNPEVIRVR